MADILISSAAEEDFAEALCWYAERSVRAAEGFEAEFELALKLIAADPDRFPRCDDRHQFLLMRRFPYQIIYRRKDERIVVIAVAHAKRRPNFWADR